MTSHQRQPRPRRHSARHYRVGRVIAWAAGLAIALLVTAALPACSTPPPAAPGVREQPSGLETICWVVDDSNHDRVSFQTLGEALLPYRDRPTGLTPVQAQLWRDNGLRVVAVPLAEIDLLHDRLRTVGSALDHWLGIVPTWTPLATGPLFPEGVTIAFDSGDAQLPGGNVRLLARAWIVPIEPSLSEPQGSEPPRDTSAQLPAMRAAMNLELLPQLADASLREETVAQSYGLDAKPTPHDAGVNFPRLALTLLPRGQDALLIVPEDPAVEWKPLPPGQPRVLTLPSDTTGGPTPPVAPDLEAAAPNFHPRPPAPAPAEPPLENVANPLLPFFPNGVPGPAPERAPTLGEAMLADVHGVGLSRRVVLILVPRVPDKYDLIVK